MRCYSTPPLWTTLQYIHFALIKNLKRLNHRATDEQKTGGATLYNRRRMNTRRTQRGVLGFSTNKLTGRWTIQRNPSPLARKTTALLVRVRSITIHTLYVLVDSFPFTKVFLHLSLPPTKATTTTN